MKNTGIILLAMAPSRRPTVLFIDHDDSFTYNLVHLLADAGADVVTTTASNVARAESWDGILLGPGHGRPDAAAATLAELTSRHPTRPVLGVCLGHQAIAIWAGGQVVRSPRPVHGERVAIVHGQLHILGGIPTPFHAARYNSLMVCREHLPSELEVTATTSEGEVMALRHRSLPIQGIQFHPESVLSDFGRQILRNWLEDM